MASRSPAFGRAGAPSFRRDRGLAWCSPPHGFPSQPSFQTARGEPPLLAGRSLGLLMGYPKRHRAVAALVPAFGFSLAVAHARLRTPGTG